MMQKCLCLNIRFAYAVTAAWNVDLPESQVAYFPDLFQSLLKHYFLRDLSLTTLCKTVFLFSCITLLALYPILCFLTALITSCYLPYFRL